MRKTLILPVLVAALVAGPVAASPASAVGTHTVTTKVTTPGGAAIPGVPLTLSDSSHTFTGSATTDAAGSATFADVPDGALTLTGAVKVGDGSAKISQAVTVDGDESVTVKVTGTQAITGRITDITTKAPVPSALVEAIESGTGWGRFSATTTASGTYSIIATPTTYFVSASKQPTYDTVFGDEITLKAGHDVRADLALAQPEIISGHVTAGGKPVAGAAVRVNEWNNDDRVWEAVFHGTTDASGAYSIEVQPGYYEVSAEAASPSPYLRTDAGATVRDPIATIFAVKAGSHHTADISLRAGAVATGKVVDSAGKPVQGMTVLVTSTNRYGQAQATTDATGAYTIEGLATGPATLELAGTRGVAAPRTISLTAGTTTKVPTIHLAKAATITGHIKAKSPRNQYLTLLDAHHDVVWNANSDSHGNVKITGLRAGAYRLVLDGTNLSKRVVVEPGKTASFGTITRANRNWLYGTVTTPSGKAVAHSYVQLTDTWGTYATSAMTDSKGRFTVFGVLSGAVRVYASNATKGYAITSVRTTVTKGKDKTGVRIKLTTGGTLTGVVKNSAGAAVPGVVVVAGPGADGSVTTDSHGRWTLRGVTPGKRTVDVYDPYPGGYRDVTRTATAVAGKTVTVPITLR